MGAARPEVLPSYLDDVAALEMDLFSRSHRHSPLAPEKRPPHFQVARRNVLRCTYTTGQASKYRESSRGPARRSVAWVSLIGTEGPKRRPDETFSKGHVVCSGMCGDASDCAPSVSPNTTCKSGDATGSDATPATDPAGPGTEAGAATKKASSGIFVGDLRGLNEAIG